MCSPPLLIVLCTSTYAVSSHLPLCLCAASTFLTVPCVDLFACAERAQSTNKEQSITIKSSGGLSEDEIQKMVRDAEQYASADKARKETIEAKNEVETLIYSSERSLDEYKARTPLVLDSVLLQPRYRWCCYWLTVLVVSHESGWTIMPSVSSRLSTARGEPAVTLRIALHCKDVHTAQAGRVVTYAVATHAGSATTKCD